MTYQDLFDQLKSLKRLSPKRMADEVVFIDYAGRRHTTTCAEISDDSMKTYGIEPGAMFLSEV